MAGRSTAVVIGCGMAGLATARVLASRFDRVTVLDRDELPDRAQPRATVPQGAHPHVLLTAGLNGLEELFPGIGAELTTQGATVIDTVRDMRVFRGMLFPQRPSGVTTVCASRPLIEQALRRRVAALPTVDIRSGTAVTGLSGDSGRVTGVLVGDEVLAADLVVDCSGRAAGASDRWLAQLGLPAPRTSVIKVDVGYTTALYRRRPQDLPGARMTFVVPQAPRQKRFGVAMPIEDDRWMVTLGGWHGEHAPTDPEGFAAFAKSLPYPSVADLIEGAEPIGPLRVHQFAATRRRHLEKLRGKPIGYLALGDSLCSFNPVYGQGMTSAVRQAIELGRALDRHRGVSAAMARAFYRGAGAVIATPWQFAAGGDFAYPETTGPKPAGMDLFNGYVARINRAIIVSPEIQVTMAKVQHLLLPPSVVLRPRMVLSVLRLTRRSKAAE